MPKYCNNSKCAEYGKPIEGMFCPSCGHPLAERDSFKKEVSADGISVSRVTNDSHDNISNNIQNTNTTIVLSGKSLEDLTLSERKAAYRKFCNEHIVNGLITPVLRMRLDEYALDLDISSVDKKEIENQVRRHNPATSAHDLSVFDRENLEVIKQKVASGRINIWDTLPKLEAMSSSENDEVQFFYSMLYCASSPMLLIRKYVERDHDSYWQAFWVYVAYIKTGQKEKAEKTLRDLSVWDTQSVENLYLLQAVGSILSDDVAGASVFFSKAKNISYLLRTLHSTVAYLVKMKGEKTFCNSYECNLYLEYFFGVRKESPIADRMAVPIPAPLRERLGGRSAGSSSSSDRAKTVVVMDSAQKGSGYKKILHFAIAATIIFAMFLIWTQVGKKEKVQHTAGQISTTAVVEPSGQNTASQTSSTANTTAKTAAPKAQGTSGDIVQSGSSSVSPSSSTSTIIKSSTITKDPLLELQSSAESGDKDAQYSLGMKYYVGDGVAQSYQIAFKYLNPLAEAGYVKAFFPVAEMYHGGRGVAKDRDAAEKWYQKAAEAGNSKAKKILINSF